MILTLLACGKSSLLYDAAWHRIGYGEDFGRPDDTKPTWSWASVPRVVGFYEVSLLPQTELLTVRYTAIGPAHVGEVCNANISIRGLTLTIALQCAEITHRASEQESKVSAISSQMDRRVIAT
jgi:hypothetical protein